MSRLLQLGQERWEQQLHDTPKLGEEGPQYVAWRTWVRMMMSCQKRGHKSMQEMVSYLLGVPEFFCTHEFSVLFYLNMVRLAEEVLPPSGAVEGTNVVPPTADATMIPPRDASATPSLLPPSRDCCC